MSSEVQKLIQRCVINYLDGNMEKFKELTDKAIKLFEQERHLYVTVGERLKG